MLRLPEVVGEPLALSVVKAQIAFGTPPQDVVDVTRPFVFDQIIDLPL